MFVTLFTLYLICSTINMMYFSTKEEILSYFEIEYDEDEVLNESVVYDLLKSWCPVSNLIIFLKICCVPFKSKKSLKSFFKNIFKI